MNAPVKVSFLATVATLYRRGRYDAIIALHQQVTSKAPRSVAPTTPPPALPNHAEVRYVLAKCYEQRNGATTAAQAESSAAVWWQQLERVASPEWFAALAFFQQLRQLQIDDSTQGAPAPPPQSAARMSEIASAVSHRRDALLYAAAVPVPASPPQTASNASDNRLSVFSGGLMCWRLLKLLPTTTTTTTTTTTPAASSSGVRWLPKFSGVVESAAKQSGSWVHSMEALALLQAEIHAAFSGLPDGTATVPSRCTEAARSILHGALRRHPSLDASVSLANEAAGPNGALNGTAATGGCSRLVDSSTLRVMIDRCCIEGEFDLASQLYHGRLPRRLTADAEGTNAASSGTFLPTVPRDSDTLAAFVSAMRSCGQWKAAVETLLAVNTSRGLLNRDEMREIATGRWMSPGLYEHLLHAIRATETPIVVMANAAADVALSCVEHQRPAVAIDVLEMTMREQHGGGSNGQYVVLESDTVATVLRGVLACSNSAAAQTAALNRLLEAARAPQQRQSILNAAMKASSSSFMKDAATHAGRTLQQELLSALFHVRLPSNAQLPLAIHVAQNFTVGTDVTTPGTGDAVIYGCLGEIFRLRSPGGQEASYFVDVLVRDAASVELTVRVMTEVTVEALDRVSAGNPNDDALGSFAAMKCLKATWQQLLVRVERLIQSTPSACTPTVINNMRSALLLPATTNHGLPGGYHPARVCVGLQLLALSAPLDLTAEDAAALNRAAAWLAPGDAAPTGTAVAAPVHRRMASTIVCLARRFAPLGTQEHDSWSAAFPPAVQAAMHALGLRVLDAFSAADDAGTGVLGVLAPLGRTTVAPETSAPSEARRASIFGGLTALSRLLAIGRTTASETARYVETIMRVAARACGDDSDLRRSAMEHAQVGVVSALLERCLVSSSRQQVEGVVVPDWRTALRTFDGLIVSCMRRSGAGGKPKPQAPYVSLDGDDEEAERCHALAVRAVPLSEWQLAVAIFQSHHHIAGWPSSSICRALGSRHPFLPAPAAAAVLKSYCADALLPSPSVMEQLKRVSDVTAATMACSLHPPGPPLAATEGVGLQ